MNILKIRRYFILLFVALSVTALSQPDPGIFPFEKGGLFGYCDSARRIIIQPEYSRADFFYDGMACVYRGSKYGYINRQGKVVVSLTYDFYSDKPARFGNGLGLVSVRHVKQDYSYFLFGYVNKKGKVVQKPELFRTDNFYKGGAAAENKESVFLLLDSNLNIKNRFANMGTPYVDYPPYKAKDLYQVTCEMGGKGLITRDGRILIPCNYDDRIFSNYSEGIFIASQSRTGAIDIENKVIVPFKYNDMKPFHEGMARVSLEHYGYVDKSGKEIIPCVYDIPDERQVSDRVYDLILGFCEGLVKACQKGQCGFLNKEGKVIIPFKYEWVASFKEGMAKFMMNRKIGFLDRQGREVIPAKYDETGHFYNGCAWVKKDGKWGYINKQGQEIFPLVNNVVEGEMMKNFSDGFIQMVKDNKLAFYDTSAKPLTGFIYDDAGEFNGGLARVSIRGLWGMIDTKGKIVVPIQYFRIDEPDAELIPVTDRIGTGFYNRQGKLVIPALYRLEEREWHDGFLKVSRDGKKEFLYKFYIDRKGNEYVEDE